jgi:hypothetical protein
MLQTGGELNLLEEAIDARAAPDLGPDDLESDVPLVAEITGEEHRRHAAGADLALDGVAILELQGEALEAVGHG